jgi:U3 small nucleolar ribonucleoprotein protein LCP5
VIVFYLVVFFHRYEESYFTRLPTTKQERHRSRNVTTLGTLGDELTRFGDFRTLEGVAGASGPSGASKKRKHFRGKKSKYL